jgi:hypothetical protein
MREVWMKDAGFVVKNKLYLNGIYTMETALFVFHHSNRFSQQTLPSISPTSHQPANLPNPTDFVLNLPNPTHFVLNLPNPTHLILIMLYSSIAFAALLASAAATAIPNLPQVDPLTKR